MQEAHGAIAPINIDDKLARIDDHWNPRIVAELNGQQVKLAKFRGLFVWHVHETEDELFLVLKGSFVMEFRDSIVTVRENEILVVPHGVEHRPVAEEEVYVMLFEPATTLNTGNIRNERTRDQPAWI